VGDVMQRIGRLERARAAYTEARRLALEIGMRSGLAAALLGLAELAVASGDAPDARELAHAQRLCDELALERYAERLARVTPQLPLAVATS